MLFIGRAGSTPVLGTEALDDYLVVKGFSFTRLTFVEQFVREPNNFIQVINM